VARGGVVRTALGTAEVAAGFCPRETVPAGDPARPDMANSSRNVAPRGRKGTAPASLPRPRPSAVRSMIRRCLHNTPRQRCVCSAADQRPDPLPRGRLAQDGSGRQNLCDGGAPQMVNAANRGTLLWRTASAWVPFSGIPPCPSDREAPQIPPRATE
jgi:hypothetical protein